MQMRYERLFSDELVKWIQPFYASQVDRELIWAGYWGKAGDVSTECLNKNSISDVGIHTHE